MTAKFEHKQLNIKNMMTMKRKRNFILARAAMTLLLALLTTATAWAGDVTPLGG